MSIHLRMPARQYDAVHQAAQQRRVSVPELIRRRVRREDDDDRDDDE